MPKRKPNRLKNFDYSTNGMYFVTICTKEKQKILWATNEFDVNDGCGAVGANSVRQQEVVPLSVYGKEVDKAINGIEFNYPQIHVENYVIMPNHIHLLLNIDRGNDGRTLFAPTISRVIKQFKGIITKQIGKPIFQRSFHDHIIRGQGDYETVYTYIDSNPSRWREDVFYIE
ncbi:MAG: transposase [Oscillospiraceae bacterium]|nr:transposase [Oscillospiraceae bacterium]